MDGKRPHKHLPRLSGASAQGSWQAGEMACKNARIRYLLPLLSADTTDWLWREFRMLLVIFTGESDIAAIG
ncbi:hypothetical protein [Kitasatospora sp. NPDC051164]|uniref:hypothetical protein n=1 Tax=Kitasatospora sp. NPDC051164 TaxID=3364055 RepID=UPI0037AA6732